jgi:hypothetical protein
MMMEAVTSKSQQQGMPQHKKNASKTKPATQQRKSFLLPPKWTNFLFVLSICLNCLSLTRLVQDNDLITINDEPVLLTKNAPTPCIDEDVVLATNTSNTNTTTTTTPTIIGYVSQEVIYGHVHFAKTAGSEINGVLANLFERVCGHKGYSYDAFQANERVRRSLVRKVDQTTYDLVNKQYKGHNRGRVPVPIMKEIGFEDCDYISLESDWTKWSQVSKWKVELHVPCRDPVGHLMSQCNDVKRTFHCDAKDFEKEVEQCVMNPVRFSLELEKQANFTLKCFDPMPPNRYIAHMGTKLQRKRIPSEYIHRDSNRPRKKDKECIWNKPDLQKVVREILVKNFDIYRFCDRCMGSQNELVLSPTDGDESS